jgi:hypothetical protein
VPGGKPVFPGSIKAALPHEMKEEHYNGGNQEEVDKRADDAGKKTTNPKDRQKDCDGNKHEEGA